MITADDHASLASYAKTLARDLMRYTPAGNSKSDTAALFQELASQAGVYLDLGHIELWNLLCDVLTLRYGASWHGPAAQGGLFPLMAFQAERQVRYLARPFGELVARLEHVPPNHDA